MDSRTLVLQNSFSQIGRAGIGRAENIPTRPPVVAHHIYWRGSLESGGSGALIVVDLSPALSTIEEEAQTRRAEQEFAQTITLIGLSGYHDIFGIRH